MKKRSIILILSGILGLLIGLYYFAFKTSSLSPIGKEKNAPYYLEVYGLHLAPWNKAVAKIHYYFFYPLERWHVNSLKTTQEIGVVSNILIEEKRLSIKRKPPETSLGVRIPEALLPDVAQIKRGTRVNIVWRLQTYPEEGIFCYFYELKSIQVLNEEL